eukprot:gb/GEZN01009418.1/.p1 GENE.gb/GEZN01009418.1/~~gb/GEZN01009418.1/.p1  ORF type:complete len:315 (-),score=17.20 gb/GEZN01009418.1/:386-1330(-)
MQPPQPGLNCSQKCLDFQPDISALIPGGACSLCLHSPTSPTPTGPQTQCQLCCAAAAGWSGEPCWSYWQNTFGPHGGVYYAQDMEQVRGLCGIQLRRDCSSNVLAAGYLYMDDGVAVDPVQNQQYTLVALQVSALPSLNQTDSRAGSPGFLLKTQVLFSAYPFRNLLDSVSIYGLDYACPSECLTISYPGFSREVQGIRGNNGGYALKVSALPYIPLLSNTELCFMCAASCPALSSKSRWYEGLAAGLGVGGICLFLGWWLHKRNAQTKLKVSNSFLRRGQSVQSEDHAVFTELHFPPHETGKPGMGHLPTLPS